MEHAPAYRRRSGAGAIGPLNTGPVLAAYAADRAAAGRRQAAKRSRALELLADESVDLVFSAQVLNEFYWVVTRKLTPPLAPELAHAFAT